jgi:TP901 family phage tail tape measure protein
MAGNVAADLVVHVGADTKDAESGLDNVGNKVNNTGKGFKTAGLAMMGIGAAAVGGLGLAVNSAMNFEQSLADINAVADLTDSQMNSVKGLALQIGKDTVFSATEGAQAIGELVKAGVPLEDVMNGAAMSAANLASAGGISIPEAATAMSNAMNMFSISGKDSASVADSFAAAANASAADVSDLTAAMAQGGPQAAAMGMSLNETNAALALFSNYGIKGSDAGTSLKTMLQRLAAPTEESAALMGELGISAFDASGNFVGMESLAGQLKTALSGMTEEQRNAALATIFGSDASRVANVLYQEGAEGVKKMTDEVSKTGVAQEMAAKRMDTLKGSIEQLKGSFETALIIIGSGFTPAIRMVADAVNGLVGMFLSMPPGLQKIVGLVVAASGVFLILAGALAYAASFLPGLAIGFGILLSPIALLIAAIGLLVAAFATDFMGIRTAASKVFGPVANGALALGDVLGNLLVGDINGATKAFNKLPKPLKPLGRALINTGRAVRDFKDDIGEKGLMGALKDAPDTFKTAIGMWKDFGNQVSDTVKSINWDNLEIKAVQTAYQLRNAFVGLAGKIGNNLGDLASAVGSWISKNGPGIASAIGNGLQAAASVAGDIAGKIADGLGDLASAVGGWISKNAPAIGTAIRNGLEAAASTAVDIAGTIVSKLGDLAGRFAEWVSGAAAGINWGALADGAYDIASTIIGKLGDLASKFKQWVTDGGAAADWTQLYATASDITADIISRLGNLNSALKKWVDDAGIASGIQNLASDLINKVTDAAPSIVGKLGDLGARLKNWYDNAIDSVNWSNLGVDIGTRVGSLARTLADKGTELVNGFKTAVINNWKEIGTAIFVLIAGLPAAIGYVGMTMAPKAAEFLQGFITGLDTSWANVLAWTINFPAKIGQAIGSLLLTLAPKAAELLVGFVTGLVSNWPTVLAWLLTIPTKVTDAVGSLIATYTPKGVELVTGFLSGVTNLWPTVTAWLGTVSDKAYTAVGSLSDTLLDRGNELINGLYQGIGDIWKSTVAPWLMLVGQMAFQTIGSLASTLTSRGTELIQGFYLAIISKMGDVKSYISTIPDSIVGGIGDLSGLLIGAGIDAIQGLIDGITSMIPSLDSIIGTVVGKFEQIWGLGDSPWPMMIEAGQDSMDGLVIGIKSRQRDISKTLDDTVSLFDQNKYDLGAVMGANLNSALGNNDALLKVDRNTIINQTVYVDARFDEVEDMIRAAQFVRELNPARKIYVDVLR